MRRVIVLGVLVAGIAAYLLLWDLPQQQKREAREAIERQLMMFNPSRVDTLRIDRPEGRLTLAREGEHWWLLDPVHELADDLAVDRGLQALREAERVRPLAEGDASEDLAVYGLDVESGGVVVEVTDTDGTTELLRVGQTNPAGTATYVQTGPGAPVELAEAELAGLVRTSHHSFRRHDLFALEDSSITAVEVRSGEVAYAARRDDVGLWFLAPPDGRRLQRWSMRNLVYDLATARVHTYVADHLSERDWRGFGLHEPVADVRFQTQEGDTFRIRMGNEGPDQMVYGRRGDESTVFLFPPQLLSTTEIPLPDLLDHSPFAMNFDRVDSVRIEWENGASFTIARVDRGWKPQPLPDDEVFVESLRTPMRNAMLGLERTQTVGTMLLAPGATAEQVLDQAPLRCEMYWPGRTLRFTLGWRSGEPTHWLHVEGSREMLKVSRDLFFRLRGCLVSAKRIDEM